MEDFDYDGCPTFIYIISIIMLIFMGIHSSTQFEKWFCIFLCGLNLIGIRNNFIKNENQKDSD